MPKYIFVTGGVLSSVGKGIVSASIAKMLQVRGFKVTVAKIDPYLNVDAGTMNPYAHGEVFVTEDGGETDLDLGHYERFLNVNLSKRNNITAGQIYRKVIENERRGLYLGQCVQIIPHVTEEIKRRIREIGGGDYDFIIVEIGGTVGDIEGLPFLEAVRQMRLEEGEENTFFIHVALVPILKATNEQKTKPLQHSVKELRRIGIQPDAIVARCREPLLEEAKKKIALYSNVSMEAVFTSYDVDPIYKLPLVLDGQGLGDYICKRLNVRCRAPNWSSWESVIKKYKNMKRPVRILMCGKYVRLIDSYKSIVEAIHHAAAELGVKPELIWVEAEEIRSPRDLKKKFNGVHGVMVLPGFGVRGAEGKINCIAYARENDIPFLGICFGLQLAIVEYARNVLKLKEANSTELDPETPHPVVTLLPEQRGVKELGGTLRLGAYPIRLVKGSIAYQLYKREIIYERHRHRYEVNPDYVDLFRKGGMEFTGFSLESERVEFIEIPTHYFFIATQAHPEFKSRPGNPSPVYYGFLKAALHKSMGLKSPYKWTDKETEIKVT